MRTDHLVVHPSARAALDEGRPVVALESSVISHGLPWPDNLELARAMEAEVRSGGAVPATTAILGGRVHVGLEDRDLEHLARAPGVLKVSRRDFPVAMAQGRDGATTVAGAMLAAHWAGIRVLATGGIGGVHRGSMPDISADLPELALLGIGFTDRKSPISPLPGEGFKISFDAEPSRRAALDMVKQL